MALLTQCIKGGSCDGRNGWVIKFDYKLDIIEKLKAKGPHTDREWRPDSYEWWVSEDYSEVLKGLFGNFEGLAFSQGRLWGLF